MIGKVPFMLFCFPNYLLWNWHPKQWLEAKNLIGHYLRQILILYKEKKNHLHQPDREKINTEDDKMSSFGLVDATKLEQGFQLM